MNRFKQALLVGLTGVAVHGAANAWTITQTFDDKADGVGCGWSAAGHSKVSSTRAFSGSKSCMLSITQGAEGFGDWGGIIDHPAAVRRGEQLWFRLRTFMPSGFNYNASSGKLKFLRFHTMSNSQSNYGYDDIYINNVGNNPVFDFIYEGEQEWAGFGNPVTQITSLVTNSTTTQGIKLGTWETYEYYVKFDTVPVSQGGMSHVRFWKDGVLMADIKNRQTLKATDAYSMRSHIFTYWNGTAPQTQSMWVDDVVLTSDTPAGRDAQGNPYIGVGVAPKRPNAPEALSAQ